MEKINATANVANDVNAAATTADSVVSVNSKEELAMQNQNVNTMTSLVLTEEPSVEVAAILKAQGITWVVKSNKKEITNHLETDKDGNHVCKFCHSVVDLDKLDDATKSKVMKAGICPKCLQIVETAAKIKEETKATVTTPRAAKGTGVGGEIRNIVAAAFAENKLNDNVIAELTNKDFSREQFKLAYALLKEITGMSADEVKSARMYNNHARYSPQVLTFNNRKFLITNDLYNKNLAGIQNYFSKLS